MTRLLERLFGRLPIGWLQLTHNPMRLAVALAGVAFADILVFVQLGFKGALVDSIAFPYQALDADLLVSAADADTLADGSPIPRQRAYQALAVDSVAHATPLYVGRLEWKLADGTVRQLQVLGVDPSARAFRQASILAAADRLALADRVLLDRRTRNVPPELFRAIDGGADYELEANQRRLTAVGTFVLGGGFSADGHLIVSDQTFLRLFPTRSTGAPNHIVVRLAPGADRERAVTALAAALPSADVQVRTVARAIVQDQTFQTTQRPIGVVFGFGVAIGTIVGIVIVYQVLSTDVADHLREYATLKAMGYESRFFLGIVFEEAIVLGLLGFVPGILVAMGLYALVAGATDLPLAMNLGRAATVLIGTVVLCAVSGALATRRLDRADPADLF